MLTILDRQYPTEVISSIVSNHLRVAVEDGELYESAKASVYNAIATAEMFTNRVLVDSLVTIALDGLDSRVIELPTAPVREIIEVRYRGADDQWHTLDGCVAHSNDMRARMELREVPVLSSTTLLNRVEIEARCGYEDYSGNRLKTKATYPLPGSVEQAIIILAKAYLEGDPLEELPPAAQILLNPYRIYPYGL